MKIIGTSNYDLDTVSDILICDNVNEYFGNKIVKFLIDTECSEESTYFFGWYLMIINYMIQVFYIKLEGDLK